MKQISWIDEKAPGFAHQFVNLLFVLACFSLLNRWGRVAPSTLSPYWQAAFCLLTVLWILSLKRLPALVARVSLSITAGIPLAFVIYVLVGAVVRIASKVHGGYDLFVGLMGLSLISLLLGIPIAGLGSMVWIAVRPVPQRRLPANLRGLVPFSNY